MTMLNKATLLVIGTMIAAATCLPAAWADGNSQSNWLSGMSAVTQRLSPKTVPSKYHPVEQEWQSQAMSKQVDLPRLPAYTGQSLFTGGGVLSNSPAGTTYYLTFRAKEESTTVLEWYKQVLQMNGWSLDPGARETAFVGGIDRSGTMCQICVMPPKQDGYRCDFSIFYRVPRQDRRR